MNSVEDEDMRDEYDPSELGEGTRGKHFAAFSQGSNVVVIDPDLVAAFPDSKAVNSALRRVLEGREGAA